LIGLNALIRGELLARRTAQIQGHAVEQPLMVGDMRFAERPVRLAGQRLKIGVAELGGIPALAARAFPGAVVTGGGDQRQGNAVAALGDDAGVSDGNPSALVDRQ